jgi:hypothetical protein
MRSGSEVSRSAAELMYACANFSFQAPTHKRRITSRGVPFSSQKAVLLGIRDYGDGIIGFLVQAPMAERPVVLPPQRARAPCLRDRLTLSRFRAKTSRL